MGILPTQIKHAPTEGKKRKTLRFHDLFAGQMCTFEYGVSLSGEHELKR